MVPPSLDADQEKWSLLCFKLSVPLYQLLVLPKIVESDICILDRSIEKVAVVSAPQVTFIPELRELIWSLHELEVPPSQARLPQESLLSPTS